MLVVLVVNMAVLMLQHDVLMVVGVAFGEMQPQSDAHQAAGKKQFQRQGLMEKPDRDNSADKGRERKIGSGAGGSEMPQG
jgi:hypothetical protein